MRRVYQTSYPDNKLTQLAFPRRKRLRFLVLALVQLSILLSTLFLGLKWKKKTIEPVVLCTVSYQFGVAWLFVLLIRASLLNKSKFVCTQRNG